jgi:3-phenylpropionate/cinnamic acid dioxygenase small subunit
MPDIGVKTLVEIERIRRVIAQYGQLMDDHRFQEWGSLFTEDAEFCSIPGQHLTDGQGIAKIIGREAIVASVEKVARAMREAGGVIHFGGNPIIDVDGDHARAWWDFIVVHARPQATELPFCGRYFAELEKREGRWRFRRRVSVRPGYPLPSDIAPTPGD